MFSHFGWSRIMKILNGYSKQDCTYVCDYRKRKVNLHLFTLLVNFILSRLTNCFQNSNHRYLVAAKDLRAGERILSDEPFVLGPNSDTSLVCFNCYLPLISKFLVCKNCGVAPICPGDGCPEQIASKLLVEILLISVKLNYC